MKTHPNSESLSTGDPRKVGAKCGDSRILADVPADLHELATRLNADALTLARTYPPQSSSMPTASTNRGKSRRKNRGGKWVQAIGIVAAVAVLLAIGIWQWIEPTENVFPIAQREASRSATKDDSASPAEAGPASAREEEAERIEFVLHASSPELEAMLDLMDDSELQQVSF